MINLWMFYKLKLKLTRGMQKVYADFKMYWEG